MIKALIKIRNEIDYLIETYKELHPEEYKELSPMDEMVKESKKAMIKYTKKIQEELDAEQE